MLAHPEFLALHRRIKRVLNTEHITGWNGTAYRSATPKYASSKDLLSGDGSLKYGGRWNHSGGFRVVYLADSPEAAMAEALGGMRYYGVPISKALPRVFVAVEVSVSTLLDLTSGSVRQRLRMSRATFVDVDWKRENDAQREAITQAIGRSAFEHGLEGLLVPSAWHNGRNLVLFIDNRQPQSTLSIINEEDLS